MDVTSNLGVITPGSLRNLTPSGPLMGAPRQLRAQAIVLRSRIKGANTAATSMDALLGVLSQAVTDRVPAVELLPDGELALAIALLQGDF